MSNMSSAAPLLHETERVPWGWRDVALVLLVVVVGTIGLLVAVAPLVQGQGAGLSTPPLFAAAVGIYVVLSAAVYFFAVRRYGASVVLLGLRRPTGPWLRLVPLLLVVQLLGIGLINLSLAAIMGGPLENPQIGSLVGEGTPRMSPTDLVLLLLVAGVAAPIGEELLFRGMIYPLLRQRLPLAAAVLANGALFAAIHLIPTLLPALFFVGVVLALLREYSRSLWPCIALHALQNSTALLLLYAAIQSGQLAP